MIIGLSGYAQSGKDTVANILVDKYGYKRVAFADKIRECLFALDPIVGVRDGSSATLHLSEYFDDFGWEKAKKLPEVRRLLQVLGTEVGRNLIDEQIWIEMALGNVAIGDKVVVTDVRFEDEAKEIKWLFGEIWRINRPNTKPANAHISEIALDDWVFDRFIDNSGDLKMLEDLIDEAIA